MTVAGPSIGSLGRFLVAAWVTARIQAGSFFEDSIMRPFPTWRLEPLGAGHPYTRNVMVFLKMVAPLASAGLYCRFGLVAHGGRVLSSVGLLGGVLG